MGIFTGISQGTFSEYSENISWECFTYIPRTYICPVGSGIQFATECYKSQEICNKAVDICPFGFNSVRDCYMTQEICDKAVFKELSC